MIKAAILVGGPSRGTRFRPLSLTVPKPLFPIAGRPMVYHHIAALAAVPDMKEILLIGFYEPDLFQPFIQTVSADFPTITVRQVLSDGRGLFSFFRYLREYQSLGTGGGLYHFRDQLLWGQTNFVFVLHADVCSTLPLKQILDFHHTHNGSCTIMGTKVCICQRRFYFRLSLGSKGNGNIVWLSGG